MKTRTIKQIQKVKVCIVLKCIFIKYYTKIQYIHPYNVELTSGPGRVTENGSLQIKAENSWNTCGYGSMPRCYHGISIIFVSSLSHVLSHFTDLWDSEEFAFASGRLVDW